ncbi:hypothetical protein HK104_007725, partial [Borealophlyctis nickersoniae]
CVEFDDGTMPVVEPGADGKPVVVSGSVRALVKYLAPEEGTVDSGFMVDFLRTYRYFVEAVDVARLLIARYIYISTQQSSQQSQSGQFLQLRILNVFKKWVDTHPQDFSSSDALYDLLHVFLETHVKADPKRAVFADSMISNLESKLTGLETRQAWMDALGGLGAIIGNNSNNNYNNNGSNPGSPLNTLQRKPRTSTSSHQSQHRRASSAPSPVTPTTPSSAGAGGFSMSSLDPDTIAAQLTLLEHTLFLMIPQHEFYLQNWT